MNQMDTDKVIKTMEMMAQLELEISELYKACGEVWCQEAELWSAIARAEVEHAKNITKMIQILKEKPQTFAIGRPITTIAINTAIAGVKTNVGRLRKGELTRRQALFILRDVEQSLLESKYTEILKTYDLEYNDLVKEIMAQTEGHKKMLSRKIEESATAA